jgi:hypothetical protein
MFDLVAIASRSLIEMDVAAMAEVACGAVVHVWTSVIAVGSRKHP